MKLTEKQKLITSACVLTIAAIIPSTIAYFFALFTGPFAYAIAPGTFLLLSVPLFDGKVFFRKTELIALGIIACLSVFWYKAGWSYGIKYQGINYLITATSLNLIIFLSLCVLFFVGRKKPTFNKKLAFNWLLVYWGMTWAFAFMGEAHV